MAAKPKAITYRDFSGGLNREWGRLENPGGVLEEMTNVIVDRQGRLLPRNAFYVPTDQSPLSQVTPNALSHSAFVYDTPVEVVSGDGLVSSPAYDRYVMWVEVNDPCLYVNKNFDNSDVNSVNNASYNPDAAVDLYWHEQAFAPFVMMDGRVFIGLGTGTNRHMVWANGTSLDSAKCYTVGHAAPTTPASVSTVTATGDTTGSNNNLTADMWYGITYTYYSSTTGVETAPATVVAALTATAGTLQTLTATLTHTVD
ncbi:MAG: hypothetical protein HN396_10855, partial [Gemmatimonadales bacterium]|nr:hypothetical protein [Gemmatimonadales bacterium]